MGFLTIIVILSVGLSASMVLLDRCAARACQKTVRFDLRRADFELEGKADYDLIRQEQGGNDQ